MLKDNNEVQKKVNMLAACGMNGVVIACRKGYAEMVSLFLKKASTLQLTVNAKDTKKGQTALTMAVLERNLEIVKLLTQEQSIDLNTTDAAYCKTPFMYACQNGLIEIVAYFLKLAETKKSKDFDLNAKADNGNTAFHYACHAEKEDVVDLIIGSAGKLKIELQLMNNDGITGYDHWPEKFESNISTGISKKPRLEADHPSAQSTAPASTATVTPATATATPVTATPATDAIAVPSVPATRSPTRSPERSPTR